MEIIIYIFLVEMTNKDYVSPEYELDWFNCPHCWAYAHNTWYNIWYRDEKINWLNLKISICAKCKNYDIRNEDKQIMIRPNVSTAPLPHEDMPNDVKELYEEARLISGLSPRAAAALLRVSLERLTAFLWESKWKLNTRIWNLSKKWLPKKVIQSLDILRVTANEWWSHSWEIDLTWKDNQETVNKLFFLVNFIVEKTISEPKAIEDMYWNLPEDKIKWIQNRDAN